jgi:hypothetical protein
MVAEYRPTTRRRARSGQAAPEANAPADTAALCATIRALWRKERLLGAYAPPAELCLDLAELDSAALRALRAQIMTRLRAHIAAAHAGTASS